MAEPGNRWESLPLDWWQQIAQARPTTPFWKTLDYTLNVPRAVSQVPEAYQQTIGRPFVRGLDYGADKLKWYFTGEGLAPEERLMPLANQPKPAENPRLAQGRETGPSLGDIPVTVGGYSFPGAPIDYTQGLPNFGLPRVAVPKPTAMAPSLKRQDLPDAPDFAEAKAAMKTAAPGKFEDQDWTTKGDDIWWYMLPGMLQGLAGGQQGGFGQALLQAAASGGMGVAKFKSAQKQEKQQFSKEEREYQRWLVANEANLAQNTFSNVIQQAQIGFNQDATVAQLGQGDFRNQLAAAQMEQSTAAAQAELGMKGAMMRYEARLKNQAQYQPQFHGSNVVTLGKDGNYTVTNTDPTHGLWQNLLNQGSLPSSAYSSQNLLANLPVEARANLMPMIAEIQKDPNFIAMTSGLGGEKQADIALLGQLQSRLMSAAKGGDVNAMMALQEVQQAMAKGALMNKLKVD